MTRKETGLLLALLFGGVAIVGAVTVVQLHRSKLWRGADAKFGDQHLKTAVALIELHKTRHGRYPEQLSDLTFVGDWDRIALNSVTYHANDSGTRYCVEVHRGWIAKPRLDLPPEFWKGTGYDVLVCRP